MDKPNIPVKTMLEMLKMLSGMVAGLEDKLKTRIKQEENLARPRELVDLDSERPDFEEAIITDIKDPFERTKKVKKTKPAQIPQAKHKWSDEDLKIIKYCVDPKTPKSRQTFDYLKSRLHPSITSEALRRKLTRLNIRVVKGQLCLK